MGHYKSNLRDIEFNLFEVLGRGDVLGHGPYADLDEDTAREMLKEVARWPRTTSPRVSSTPTATRPSTTRRRRP
jgi:hypothetical protein